MREGFLDLGELQGTEGDYDYPLPADAEPLPADAEATAVNGVIFTVAPLR